MFEHDAVTTVMLRLEPSWSTRNPNYPPDDFINTGVVLNCDTAMKFLWIVLKSLKDRPAEYFRQFPPPNQQCVW